MKLTATCHCGGTVIEVTGAPHEITECNCTFCFKRGGLWAYYPPDEVTLRDNHSIAYSSSPETHIHYHCRVCGCSTHSRCAGTWTETGFDASRPRVTVNARLFDDFDLSQLPVARLDGRHLW
jgi:hypothetical protein